MKSNNVYVTNMLLHLNHIKRWAIIPTTIDQSVAEHCFNVAMLASGWFNLQNLKDHDVIKLSDVIANALCHDIMEAFTGDIPTPAKNAMGVKEDAPDTVEERFVNVFDALEAARFIRCFALRPNAKVPSIDNTPNNVAHEIYETAFDRLHALYDELGLVNDQIEVETLASNFEEFYDEVCNV